MKARICLYCSVVGALIVRWTGVGIGIWRLALTNALCHMSMTFSTPSSLTGGST
jgi:hypothetical protein